jgi:hypothetical protein
VPAKLRTARGRVSVGQARGMYAKKLQFDKSGVQITPEAKAELARVPAGPALTAAIRDSAAAASAVGHMRVQVNDARAAIGIMASHRRRLGRKKKK